MNMPNAVQPQANLGAGATGGGDMLYQRWLQQHPNAGQIEKDVMRKAFGAREQPGSGAQVAPQQAAVPAATAPQPQPQKMAAIGRAVGGTI